MGHIPIAMPKPLPSEEQLRLAVLARAGDKAAEKRLVECNIRLAFKVAQQHCRPDSQEFEDAFAAACLGLAKAAKSFDPTRGVKFITYAWWSAKNEVVAEWQRKKMKGKRRRQDIPDPVSLDDDTGGGRLGDLVADPKADTTRPIEEREEVEQREHVVGDLLIRLDRRRREAIEDNFGLGGRERKSLKRTAANLGITHQRACQLVDSALEMMRDDARKRRVSVPA